MQLSEIEYILQAMQNLPRQVIKGKSGRSLQYESAYYSSEHRWR